MTLSNILDQAAHYDTLTISDFTYGSVVAHDLATPGFWSMLWPPEPLLGNIGNALMVTGDDINAAAVQWGPTFLHLSLDSNDYYFGDLTGGSGSITHLPFPHPTFGLVRRLALKNDVPGGTAANPAPILHAYYGTDDTGGNPKWVELSSTTAPHPLLKPPPDGKHSDTVDYTPANLGALILGNANDKWDVLLAGSDNEILIANGSDVAWGTYDTDAQGLIVYTSGGYQLLNDIASTSTRKYYGAKVNNGNVTIGWFDAPENPPCGGGGGGSTGCEKAPCAVSISVDSAQRKDDDKTKVVLRLTVTFDRSIRWNSQPTEAIFDYKINNDSIQSAHGTVISVSGISLTATVTIDVGTTNEVTIDSITLVAVIPDTNIVCDSNDPAQQHKIDFDPDNCRPTTKVIVPGDNTTPPEPSDTCPNPPVVASMRVSVANAGNNQSAITVTVQFHTSGYAQDSPGDNSAAVAIHYPGGGITNYSFLGNPPHDDGCYQQRSFSAVDNFDFLPGQTYIFCLLSISSICCSNDNVPVYVPHDLCVKVTLDENGNGNGDGGFPIPPPNPEPPPPAPTGNCNNDPAPVISIQTINVQNFTIIARGIASRFITGQSLGSWSLTDVNTGNVIRNGDMLWVLDSNQPASRQVVGVSQQGVLAGLQDGEYNLCVNTGNGFVCWDDINVAVPNAVFCVRIKLQGGNGNGGPPQPGGGGGGGGGGDGGRGGIIPIPDCVPQGGGGGGGAPVGVIGIVTSTLSKTRPYLTIATRGLYSWVQLAAEHSKVNNNIPVTPRVYVTHVFTPFFMFKNGVPVTNNVDGADDPGRKLGARSVVGRDISFYPESPQAANPEGANFRYGAFIDPDNVFAMQQDFTSGMASSFAPTDRNNIPIRIKTIPKEDVDGFASLTQGFRIDQLIMHHAYDESYYRPISLGEDNETFYEMETYIPFLYGKAPVLVTAMDNVGNTWWDSNPNDNVTQITVKVVAAFI